MQAGKLRHRIMLQQPVETQNEDTGSIVEGWEDVKCIWAEVYALSAREFVASHAVQSEVTTRITIRCRSDITNRHRFVYRGRIYNIQGVLPDPDSGIEYMTLPCSEGVNDG